ncbi:unnamed protein product, partial [Mesorhabditis spiculigera]
MASEYLELVEALLDRVGHRSGNIGIVAHCDTATKHLEDSLPEACHAVHFGELSSLAGAEQLGLDGLIFNKTISHEKVVKEKRLDDFVKIALKSLKVGGTCIVREDLSATAEGKDVASLTDFFDVYRHDENGTHYGFEFYACQPVVASIAVKSNYFDLFWTLTKKEFAPVKGDMLTFRDFLDKTQYTNDGIGAYEYIFGAEFISPGGWDENLRVLKRFGSLKPGQKMLDIGVGIGGGARQAASEFGLEVTGMDLSTNMLVIALERNHKDRDTRVKYMIGDAMQYEFPENHFDVIFSRDCVQHIEDIPGLFKRIMKWLKPGGQVLITMYGRGAGEQSEQFKEYVKQRAYFLRNRDEIRKMAVDAGFADVKVDDMTYRFKEILQAEKQRLEDEKTDFLRKFTQKEYDSLTSGWNNKLGYIAADNHNWNYFLATKPLHK